MADHWLIATGNWNAAATWSTAGSGQEAGSTVPGAGDNVFLDANSGANTVLTVNVASACLNFDCTGFTGTLTGSSALSVAGTVLKLVSGMTWSHTGTLNLNKSSGTVETTFAGKAISGNFTHNPVASTTWKLLDKFTFTGSQLTIGVNCTLDANGQDVLFSGNAQSISGTATFYNLGKKPASASSGRTLTLSGNITVTNALTLDSNSTDAERRLLITSDTRGTARTITAKTVTANYCDFEDITGAGTADWDLSAADGGSGNCGGNTDITFTTPATVYQVGTGDQSFSADVWKTTSNGATAARRPLPQDTAVLDASSTTGTMTQNLQRIGTISAAAFTGTLTTSTACTCYGSITLGSEMTLTASTQAYTLAGRGTHTLTSAGKEWAKNFTIDAPGGTYTLEDVFETTLTRTLTLTRGTFDANDFDLNIGLFNSSNNNTRTLLMRSGTWTLRGTAASIFQFTSVGSLTLNAGTSTVKIASNLAAADVMPHFPAEVTFYNFENATSGNFAVIVRGRPTFNQFKVNAGRKQQFYRGETVTATTWILEGTDANPIELASDHASSAAGVAKAGDGLVVANYATITRLTATPYQASPPILRWYATNSTGVGTTTGWTFSAPPGAGLKILGIQSPAKVNGVALPMKINGVMA